MGGVHRQDEEAGTPPPGLVPAVVVKGKRSKRQRVHAPPVVLTAAAEWSLSAASATAAAAEEDSGTSSPSADEAASTNGCVTEEEEDMALCLMLLSRGEPAAAKEAKDGGDVAVVKEARFRSRRPADGAAAGEFVYECKTCNKCFPSFQALGGHRTSHKKPRMLPPVPPPPSEDKNTPATLETSTTAPSLPPSPFSVPPAQETTDATVPAIPVVPVVPKQEPGTGAAAAAVSVSTTTSSSRHPRVHECSICGAEFASGQALGGHMRRHRPLVPAAARDEAPRKEKSLLELDLNMPAPCDEAETLVTSPRFGFAVAERQQAAMLFPAAAASALVDCHY